MDSVNSELLSVRETVNKIFYYYENFGEPETQIEHMVQGAKFAERDGRKAEIIIALFLQNGLYIVQFSRVKTYNL